ncbi:aldo/keto reductase [Nocardia sp. CDC153]|uniref:aldo/keto reductase n=1 Tax=Nocardia sp. CDC153 TaxID=3112167 RepID=UPI002DBD90FA|nr:aldo/keto reductase [Nocardia sp. CDC153]MEC3955208.1 aldo/keto reductase [Nocardia sp. CDC153]
MNYRSETSAIPAIVLADGQVMPKLGFGVYKVAGEQATETISTALGLGYRSIDTASFYGNEDAVGRAVRESGLPRDEVFITTKLWNADHGYDATLRAFDASMERLGLDTLDLYLIHWPVPSADLYVDSFRALQALKRQGRVVSIGVSNFTKRQLERLIGETGEVPAINQVELHPYFAQSELRAFHAAHGIVTEAWSPLGRGAEFNDSVIIALADKLGRTPAQIILRWHMQLGNVAIPKSMTPARMAENLAVFDFELTGREMTQIAGIDKDGRQGADPDLMDLDAPVRGA